ncbi:hypothetical protein [Ancylobacter sp. IITR112]|uniref:hypothetical protein n=1 Tax=Ancylobacter sp. IITR112 TaxID=3138073 RepID=UPI00352AFE11
MLAGFFWVTLVAGVSAAVVLWVLAARVAIGIVRVSGASSGGIVGALFWPFGARQMAGAAPAEATLLNKMLVAFFAALLVAIASMAVYSNLTLVLPAPTP